MTLGIEIEGYDVAEVRRARVGWVVRFRFRPAEDSGIALKYGAAWRPTRSGAEKRGRRWQHRRQKAEARRTDGYELWPWKKDS